MRTRRSAVNREGVGARLGIIGLAFGVWRLAFSSARINKPNENENNRIGLFMLSNRFVSLYKSAGLGLLVLTLPQEPNWDMRGGRTDERELVPTGTPR
jgi:hypothetical protein